MTNVMSGVHATPSERLTMGCRDAITRRDSLLGPTGTTPKGHEHHTSVTSPHGDALELRSRFGTDYEGFTTPKLFASYLHQHLAATPELAERFVLAGAKAALFDQVQTLG